MLFENNKTADTKSAIRSGPARHFAFHLHGAKSKPARSRRAGHDSDALGGIELEWGGPISKLDGKSAAELDQ